MNEAPAQESGAQDTVEIDTGNTEARHTEEKVEEVKPKKKVNFWAMNQDLGDAEVFSTPAVDE